MINKEIALRYRTVQGTGYSIGVYTCLLPFVAIVLVTIYSLDNLYECTNALACTDSPITSNFGSLTKVLTK